MSLFNQNGAMTNQFQNDNFRNHWNNQNGYTMMRPNYQVLPGRVVGNVDEITPQEVPMDGSVSLFPQSDYSCIYAKTWTKEGTIATVRYVPEQPQENGEPKKSPLEERLDRIEKQLESLNKKLYRPKNIQKRNNSHPNKEVNDHEQNA